MFHKNQDKKILLNHTEQNSQFQSVMCAQSKSEQNLETLFVSTLVLDSAPQILLLAILANNCETSVNDYWVTVLVGNKIYHFLQLAGFFIPEYVSNAHRTQSKNNTKLILLRLDAY